MIITPNSPNGALKNGTAVGIPAPLTTTQACANQNAVGTLLIRLAANPTLCLTQQAGPVSLAPGAKAIVYFKVPQNVLTSVDAGSASSVAVYAGKVGSPQSVTVAAK